MSVTYTWKVTGVKTKNEGSLQDAVVQVYWEKIGTNEAGLEGRFQGATPFNTADIDPATFIPFENLTEAKVLEWIQSLVTGGYEDHVNSQIQRQIDEKVNPVVDKPLPWTPQPQPAPTVQ